MDGAPISSDAATAGGAAISNDDAISDGAAISNDSATAGGAAAADGSIADASMRERAISIAQAAGLVVVLVLLSVAAWHFGWTDYLIGEEGMSRLSLVVEENLALAIAIYIGSLVVGGVLLAVPGFLFAIAAGALFGPWLGTACYVVGATIAAVIAFLAGRTFLKGLVKPIAMRNKHLKRWLFDEVDRDAVIVLLITRLFPIIPYNVQNFAYGTTDVSLWTYTWCTAVFAIPGTAVYTFAVAGVFDESQRALYLVVAAVLLVVVGAIIYMLNRKYAILKRTEHAD